MKINTDLEAERKVVEFEAIFKNVLSALQNNIESTQARVAYDFTKCPLLIISRLTSRAYCKTY